MSDNAAAGPSARATRPGERIDGIDVDAMVARVRHYLDLKDESARHDIYAWSDGRVTPYEPDESEDDAHLVGTFTPGEDFLTDSRIRESILRGLHNAADD